MSQRLLANRFGVVRRAGIHLRQQLCDAPPRVRSAQAELRALLKELQGRFNLAMLLVSHDLGGLAAVARRVLVMYAGRLVEAGTPADVFREPLHPYSRGLLAALPRPPARADSPRRLPTPIAGSPPDPAAVPEGCAFEPRCPDRLPACAERPPREERPAEGRRVRCFKYGG